MDPVKNIILNTQDEALEKLLSPYIKEQFPQFMREDYSKLVLLIKSYYEWLDQRGNAGYVTFNLDTLTDVDENAEEFINHFKNTYLVSFPTDFAVNENGNKPNNKTLLKKIRDFYGNKGTESAYKFLFRILYSSNLEIYYPKQDVLRVSDGQWIEPKSIKTTSYNGTDLFGGKNGQLLQYNGNEVSASAFIDNVIQYNFNGNTITEFFINEINGDFQPNRIVKIVGGSGEWEETAYSVLGKFFIETPGRGYRIGDVVSVAGATGSGFSARVDQVGLGGSVKRISITNSGLKYPENVVVNVFSETGTQTAKVIAVKSAVTNYPGYFAGNRGKVSSNKSIQDGHYYQDFSYELKSSVSLDTYFSVLKSIVHPAGMRMFGSILLKETINNNITSTAQLYSNENPLIGRYTPYALRTFNNLRQGIFLPNQVIGATLQVWLSTYSVAGNTTDGVTANIGALSSEYGLGVNRWYSISNGITFTVPQGDTPNTDVWLTPRFKPEAVNTHPSLIIRPVNEIGSDVYSRDAAAQWKSYGYWAGLTVGRLGLSAARSYFIVAKARTLAPIVNVGTNMSDTLISDTGALHGIAVGLCGDSNTLRAVAWNYSTSVNKSHVLGVIGKTGEWFVLSNTFNGVAPNNGSMSLFCNGLCFGTVASAFSPAATITGQSFGVAMSSTLDSTFDGEIAEILCYQGDVGKVDREKIEGYLAHKYDLVSKLPSSHPYKTSPPGASFPNTRGKWYGTTGDFYPIGYNPYIGSTTEVGLDGTTAPLGSLFIHEPLLGYTYTVADENGITGHNPIGYPLGGTAAWYSGKEKSVLDPGLIAGLVLWLKPENIGVCGSVANGRSADVWRDASPFQNHALPPTWGRFNGSGYASAGVTIDKLRPVLSVGSLAGPTGVCFNGGVIYAPTTVWNGASLAQWIQMGNTHGAGTTAERILTGQHLYLTNPLNLPDEADIFVVMRPTVDGYDKGLGLFSSDAGLTAYRRDDTVLYHRSYNPVDRNTALANSTYYRVLPNGTLLYPSVAPSGLVGFRPSGSKTGVQQNTIAYDPHVSGVCFGVAVGEWRRDSSRRIESFLNGDASKNYSLSSGRRIAAVSVPNTDDYMIRSGLILWLDPANSNSYPGTGTSVFDLSGVGAPSIIRNQVSYSSANGGIFNFDGVNDYIEVPYDQRIAWTPSGIGNNTLTVDMWVRSTDVDGRYLSKPWNGNGEYNYWIYADHWYVGSGRVGNYYNFSSLATGRWENVTCIVTPTQFGVYRNGVAAGNFASHNIPITDNSPPSGNVSLPLCLMTLYPYSDGSWSQPTYSISGSMGAVKMYNRVLSAAEIMQNYNVTRGKYGV